MRLKIKMFKYGLIVFSLAGNAFSSGYYDHGSDSDYDDQPNYWHGHYRSNTDNRRESVTVKPLAQKKSAVISPLARAEAEKAAVIR